MSVTIPLLPLYALVAWVEENLFVCLYVFLSFTIFFSLFLNAELEGCNGKKGNCMCQY